jgi:hypothetical protein
VRRGILSLPRLPKEEDVDVDAVWEAVLAQRRAAGGISAAELQELAAERERVENEGAEGIEEGKGEREDAEKQRRLLEAVLSAQAAQAERRKRAE